MFNQFNTMPSLNLKLNLAPGIIKNVDLDLDELIKAFNTSWTLEDRLELVTGLDLDISKNKNNLRVLGRVLSQIDLDSLSVSELMIFNDKIQLIKKKINVKKDEVKDDLVVD